MEEKKAPRVRESKRERFVRIAEYRMSRVIRDIRSIGKLANKNNYEYSEDDIRQIRSALNKELSELENKFKSNTSTDETVFKFKDNG